jgi:phenylalanyl-tRNA synthetase alpha chain
MSCPLCFFPHQQRKPFVRQRIEELRTEMRRDAGNISSEEAVERFRIDWLARKGRIAQLFENLKDVPAELKPELGKALNALRGEAQTLLDTALAALLDTGTPKAPAIDPTLPGRAYARGHMHIVTQTIEEITDIFRRMGFSVADGPEVESDYYNFEALNFPADHPARDMQDTFFISEDELLRTHTTPVQIRLMERFQPPIRAIFPGKVYRNEVISARSHVQFHQIDGLFVDTNVTFADLKGTLITFANMYYGEELRYRFRPSFFPFTEPSAEMDIGCYLCNGKGCRVCKHTGWLEILGCGMVDPNVYASVGCRSRSLQRLRFRHWYRTHSNAATRYRRYPPPLRKRLARQSPIQLIMLLSLRWLQKYVEITETPEELEAILTGVGLEVDAVTDRRNAFGEIVVGEVVDLRKTSECRQALCLYRRRRQ